MTLSVNVWVWADESRDGIRFLEFPTDGSDLAGTEVTRTGLWGSPVVRSLGAIFLPRLADGDLWVSDDEVEAFIAECDLLLANLATIASALDHREDYIRFRLTNMINAGRRALQAGGGVAVQ